MCRMHCLYCMSDKRSYFTTQSKNKQREHCKWPKMNPKSVFNLSLHTCIWALGGSVVLLAACLILPWVYLQWFQFSHHQPNEVNSTVWLKLMTLSALLLTIFPGFLKSWTVKSKVTLSIIINAPYTVLLCALIAKPCTCIMLGRSEFIHSFI